MNIDITITLTWKARIRAFFTGKVLVGGELAKYMAAQVLQMEGEYDAE